MKGRTHRKTRKSGGFLGSKGEQALASKGGFLGSKGGFLGSKGEQALASKGGFLPSIMGPFAQNASMLTPIAVAAGYRLVNNSKTLRKNRGKTRSKANLRRRR